MYILYILKFVAYCIGNRVIRVLKGAYSKLLNLALCVTVNTAKIRSFCVKGYPVIDNINIR